MIKLIQPAKIEKITKVAAEILEYLKANKIVIKNTYAKEERISGGVELYRVTRFIDGNDRFYAIEAATKKAFNGFAKLIKKLVGLLSKHGLYQTHKLKDYASADVIQVKLCRDLVSELDDLYMLGEINLADIKEVYSILGKSVPKRFKLMPITDASKKITGAISVAIRGSAEHIKHSAITHYEELVKKIDPADTAQTPKEFLTLALRRLSDIDAVRMCITCKFDRAAFEKMVTKEFEGTITYSAVRISEHCCITDAPKVKVNNIHVGAKGFDISITVNDQTLFARAIPVEGYFVRFHYRYIIT